jgi:hypothetical protein
MIALLVYIVASLYFGRRNPLFYLIIVYALQQGPAAFIDQSVTVGGKSIFLVYDQIFIDVLFITTVLIAIFLIKAKSPRYKSFGEKLIWFYFFYIAFLFLISLVMNDDPVEVFLTGRQLLYISLSFFLWLSIFYVVTREQYEEFLRFLFYVTPVSSILYILNSSGRFTIFNSEFIYQEIEGLSGIFFRDFATIPTQLVPVLVISLLSLMVTTIKLPRSLIVANMIILPVAVLFTFTRSVFLGIIIQLAVLMGLYLYSGTRRVSKNILALVFMIALVFVPTYFIAARVYPDAVEYFTERLSDAAVEQQNDQNVDIRLSYLNKTIEITNETSVITGAGLNRKYYPQMESIGAWIADSTIPYLLYHTGWLGVCLLYMILIFFIVDSVQYFRKTNDWLVAFLSSSIITTTISSLLMGGGIFTGTVWTFMNLALYTTLRYNGWKKVDH